MRSDGGGHSILRVQGYLAHTKQHPPLGPPKGPRHSPTVGSEGGAVFHERGTHVDARPAEVARAQVLMLVVVRYSNNLGGWESQAHQTGEPNQFLRPRSVPLDAEPLTVWHVGCDSEPTTLHPRPYTLHFFFVTLCALNTSPPRNP